MKPQNNKILHIIWEIYMRFFKATLDGVKYNKEAEFLKHLDNNPHKQRVFYFGPTTNCNLGDRGQVLCIIRWIKENYPGCELYPLSAFAILCEKVHFIERFKAIYNERDIIVFQSGYNVNDMGANHPYMHKLILENFPDAKILMMPESIFFKSEETKKEWAKFYSKGTRFLFLARDVKSLQILDEMCPDLPKHAFPDIVTTLIGQYSFTGEREHKVCICRRNDGEKFYSDEALDKMADKIRKLGCEITVTDTTINAKPEQIANNLELYIEDVIKKFSQYECMVTDRFHGVVFSLAAGTPVVVVKTNNHKVTEALKWFDGIYDDYVFLADSLENAVELVKHIITLKFSHTLKPYFKENYFDKLRQYFSSVVK